MKKEFIQGFVENVNKYMPTIERVVKENLGVDAKFEIKVLTPIHTIEQFVILIEKGDATKRQMTATPLLQHLFKDARLRIDCWYNEEKKIGEFCIDVRYTHPDGGENGHMLYGLYIDFATGESW